MPTRARLDAFVDRVVAGEFVMALREFYLDDAVTRENNGPERRGLATLIAIETAVLGAFAMLAHRPRFVILEGDQVAIGWTFDVTDATGTTRRMEEVAVQRWQGERIAEERFHYDPTLLVVPA